MIFLALKVINKKENILLSRIEVEAEISFKNKATPSTEEVKQQLSKTLEVGKDLIVLKQIDTSFGDTSAKILAYQYLSKDDLNIIEPKIKKKEAKQEKKKGTKPAEEKKEASSEEKPDKQKTAEKEESKKE